MASEFIEEWNKVQPFHIKEAELKNPTEHFVRKCLSLLMKQMLVKLEFMENVNLFDLVSGRSIKVLFCRLILIARTQKLEQPEFDWSIL